ncbi:MAG: NERD domain-containing protein [Thiotrichaceae bacterium]|nr:NERD domain-containing protein [Thiotrichaceae bacterium]
MTFKAFKGQSFNHTHENKAFDELHDLLKKEWTEKKEALYLLGNFVVGGRELDALIIKRKAIIIVDFKDYGGSITFSENQHWMCNDNLEVKGGSSVNPLQQIKKNKSALSRHIDSINLQSSLKLGHISGLIIFHQPIKFDATEVPHPIHSWFYVTDLKRAFRSVNTISSPAILLSEKDIKALAHSIKASPYLPDGKYSSADSIASTPITETKIKIEQHPYEAFGANMGEKKVWDWVKEAFRADEAVIYYRYPIFSQLGNLIKEPDILMLHREYGLWVFECKGCHINNIQSIQGHEWVMSDWYSESMKPIFQAEDQMFAIKNKLDERRETRDKVFCNFRVALPFVKLNEWKEKNFHKRPSTGCVLVYEKLTPAILRKHVQQNSKQNQLSDSDWILIKGILGGVLPNSIVRPIPTGTASNNPTRVIQYIEEQLKILDSEQQKISYETPDGPQRLRGLAGTGKTVMFAKRMAKMHLKHPDWTIGYVFFTRALYEQIRSLVTTYYQEMHPEHTAVSPNWNKLKILHAWGGKEKTGFYYDLAVKCGLRPKTLYDVKNETDLSSPSDSFEYICQWLQEEATDIPVIYDALLIDEGQDLPPVFYQLAYATLSKERRIYWAYDEAQGIGSLIIPNAKTMFGEGSAIDLKGQYKGGIYKSHSISACYRTPELLLMAAHAVNMGLFRKGGVLQGVSNQQQWNKLGYDVIEGSFEDKAIGTAVSIQRNTTPHPTDKKDFPHKDALGSHLFLKTVANGKEEHEWIAEQVAKDIELGFKPEDLLITALSGDFEKEYFAAMKESLQRHGVKSYIAGVDGSPDTFRLEGCVTIANIFRAKGNEAWKVYACRFNYATQPLGWKQETELHKRNEAFVALTRARIWCVVSGINSPIFDELTKVVEQYPKLTFLSFNKKSLKRTTDEDLLVDV